jgi:hypothetical protein
MFSAATAAAAAAQVHVPEGLTALDLDLIKLTAQFVARNGAAFLTGVRACVCLNAFSMLLHVRLCASVCACVCLCVLVCACVVALGQPEAARYSR